ncbi:MAG: hypothetical protein HON60_00040 [Gammaproteobacteria bacterium]|jgi:hypothetical protein|nr:hypothetical protein [Gammaproteobacteria bacterium]
MKTLPQTAVAVSGRNLSPGPQIVFGSGGLEIAQEFAGNLPQSKEAA